MSALYEKHCETCQLGAPVVTEEQANELLLSVPAWKREFHDDVEKLEREFHFEFRGARRVSGDFCINSLKRKFTDSLRV